MVLQWIADNLLAVATFVLALVTVGVTLLGARHDRMERQRERRYSRVLQAQAALRKSATLAARLEDSRSWRAKLVPILITTYVGIGTLARLWDAGRAAELMTLVAAGRNLGADSVENTANYAFLEAAYDVAGLAGQVGQSIRPDVLDRLLKATTQLHGPGQIIPRRRSSAVLDEYISAVNDVHGELERIVHEERFEPRVRKGPMRRLLRLLGRRRSRLRRSKA